MWEVYILSDFEECYGLVNINFILDDGEILVKMVIVVLECGWMVDLILEMCQCGIIFLIGYLEVIYEDVLVVVGKGVMMIIYLFNVMCFLYYCNLGIFGVLGIEESQL